jgi:hypothetical protein
MLSRVGSVFRVGLNKMSWQPDVPFAVWISVHAETCVIRAKPLDQQCIDELHVHDAEEDTSPYASGV